MKKLLAILTAALFAFTAALPSFAAESTEMYAAPAAKSAKGGHKAKKAKKVKKTAKRKATSARKNRR